VATYGVVNPAVRGLAQESRAVLMAKGVDSSAFLEMADTRLSRLAPPPIVPRAAEINEIVGNAIEAVLIGKLSAAEALRRADKKVNELLR
jgi:multiple sugar transport system substrate-binding protein